MSHDLNFFMQSINTITQWELKSPGCEQSMRLLDFFGKLALQEFDEIYSNAERDGIFDKSDFAVVTQAVNQNLLLLNTLIAGTIRQNLQGENGKHNSTNYPFATRLMNEIGKIRKAEGLAERNRKPIDWQNIHCSKSMSV